MKTVKLAALASALLIGMASAGAMAQASGVSATPAAASVPMTKKEMRIANRQLAKAVRKALFHAKPTIPLANMVILVKDGVVSLAGSVPSTDMSAQATTVAQGVPGVKSVNNKLDIKEPGDNGR